MTDSLVNNLYSGKFQSSKLVACGLINHVRYMINHVRFIDLSKQGNGKKKSPDNCKRSLTKINPFLTHSSHNNGLSQTILFEFIHSICV